MSTVIFSKTNLPSDPKTWKTYRKKVLTKATKIWGPFSVETSEGILNCQDGYLAIDERGNFYPIDRKVMHLSYEKAVEGTSEPLSYVEWFSKLAESDWPREVLVNATTFSHLLYITNPITHKADSFGTFIVIGLSKIRLRHPPERPRVVDWSDEEI